MKYKSNDPDINKRIDYSENIVCSAFVDDTWWAAGNKTDTDEIVKKSQQFFTMNGIEINPKKTKLIVINESEETKEEPFMFGIPQTEVKRSASSTGERLLGVYISADGEHKTQKEQINSEVQLFITTLQYKTVTDQQAIYLINCVLLPAIIYRNKLLPLTEAECEKIDNRLARLIKSKCKLAVSTPTTIIHQEYYYGVRKLWDLITEDALTNYYCRINGNDISARVNYIREEQLRDNQAMVVPCHHQPLLINTRNDTNMNGKIVNMLVEKQMSYQVTEEHSIVTPIYKILPLDLLNNPKVRHQLIQYNIRYLDQLMDYNGKITLTWRQVTNTTGTLAPDWYKRTSTIRT